MKVARNVSHFQFFFPCFLGATILLLLFVGQAAMAAKAQQLWQGTATAKVHGPSATMVWPFFADYCNLYRIFSLDASFCTEGVPGRIGQVRYIASKEGSPIDGKITYFVRWEQHNLTAIDPINRSLTFDVMQNNLVVKTYRATMSVLPATYGCQIKWEYLIDPFGGFTSRQLHGLVESVLLRAAEKIENSFINLD